MISIALVLL